MGRWPRTTSGRKTGRSTSSIPTRIRCCSTPTGAPAPCWATASAPPWHSLSPPPPLPTPHPTPPPPPTGAPARRSLPGTSASSSTAPGKTPSPMAWSRRTWAASAARSGRARTAPPTPGPSGRCRSGPGADIRAARPPRACGPGPVLLRQDKGCPVDPYILTYAWLNGILVGAMLGGIALGLSLIFGVLRIVNFAHGSFLMLALYTAFWLQKLGGIDPYLSVLIAAPLMFALGYCVQCIVIGPLIRRERALVVEPISALLLTAGVCILIDNLALMAFGPNVRSTPSALRVGSFMLGPFPVNSFRVIAAAAALVLATGVWLWLARTDMGRAIRATAQNRDAAAMSGIDVPLVYNVTFGLGCALVGVMGCLIAPFIPITPQVGLTFGIKSFIVVVLGGIGSIAGSLVGGIVIGLFESLAAQFVATPTASIFSLGLFILILLMRPQGLMGAAK